MPLAPARQLLLIRPLEEKRVELSTVGKIQGFLHLSIGEDAVAVGAIQALTDDDIIIATYANRGRRWLMGCQRGLAGYRVPCAGPGPSSGWTPLRRQPCPDSDTSRLVGMAENPPISCPSLSSAPADPSFVRVHLPPFSVAGAFCLVSWDGPRRPVPYHHAPREHGFGGNPLRGFPEAPARPSMGRASPEGRTCGVDSPHPARPEFRFWPDNARFRCPNDEVSRLLAPAAGIRHRY